MGALAGACALAAVAGLSACSGSARSSGGEHAGRGGATAVTAAPLAPPGRPYTCALDVSGTIYGTYGDASAIGWAGNDRGVVACLGGSFFVQGNGTTYGFGVYDDSRTRWANADGYLPALVTSFRRAGAQVSITNFADEVTLGFERFVVVYSRVAVHNPTRSTVRIDPMPSRGLVPLTSAPVEVRTGATADHDYAIAVDRFAQSYPWPSEKTLAAAGGFDQHFAHMRSFWDSQLSSIAQLQLPDPRLADAYRSGYIYTRIARSGVHIDTGVNGYEMEFSHDVVGILATMFTQGDFTDAHALLSEARHVVGAQFQYVDGLWTYPWPWAIYLLKTGDLGFVQANFSTEGPGGASEPSIKDTAHLIAADRTGPGGIMQTTDDIDSHGLWTIDDYEALMGLAAYRYIAQRVGDQAETAWATEQYDSLLSATNQTLDATISRYHLDYVPCSIVQPNTANRCANPEDANWAAPFLFGRWAWDGGLFGADVSGPGLDLIDATYSYGFDRLAGKLPAADLGGYPGAYYSNGYNAGYGSWGLASHDHRDQGILGYEFMIDHTQSGPYSWWESNSAPNRASPWAGDHPATGQGSSPHAWGIAQANKVLLDSLVAQRSDGSVLVGRGVPDNWVRTGETITVANFPAVDGRRMGFTISTQAGTVTLRLSGATGPEPAPGPVVFELPAFVDNIARADTGAIDNPNGTVTLPSGATSVTVDLVRPV